MISSSKVLFCSLLAASLIAGLGYAQDLGTLTSTKGKTLAVQGLKVNIKSIEEYQGAWLDTIYLTPNAVPIRLYSGVIQFINIAKIVEYHANATSASISLDSGGQVSGAPFVGCTLLISTVLGDISVLAENVASLKLSTDNIKIKYKDMKATPGAMEWPDSYKARATFSFVAGDSIEVSNLAVVYIESGLDNMWIPAKPYSTWKLMQNLPITFSDFDTELSFDKVQYIILKKSSSNIQDLVIFLRSGERIDANIKESASVLAFLGTTESGFVHMPLDKIARIDFK